jgi:hypothetical protein
LSKRRTIKIDELKARANQTFVDSEENFRDGRKAIFLFVEDILMKTDNYHGFRYLTQDELKSGVKPGIVFPESFEDGGKSTFPDDSRIKFY